MIKIEMSQIYSRETIDIKAGDTHGMTGETVLLNLHNVETKAGLEALNTILKVNYIRS
jgi:hypothetical protein